MFGFERSSLNPYIIWHNPVLHPPFLTFEWLIKKIWRRNLHGIFFCKWIAINCLSYEAFLFRKWDSCKDLIRSKVIQEHFNSGQKSASSCTVGRLWLVQAPSVKKNPKLIPHMCANHSLLFDQNRNNINEQVYSQTCIYFYCVNNKHFFLFFVFCSARNGYHGGPIPSGESLDVEQK